MPKMPQSLRAYSPSTATPHAYAVHVAVNVWAEAIGKRRTTTTIPHGADEHTTLRRMLGTDTGSEITEVEATPSDSRKTFHAAPRSRFPVR